MGVKEAKQALRQQISGWRDGLDPAQREAQSARVAARVLAQECYRAADSVLVYAHVGSEVATPALVRAADAAAQLQSGVPGMAPNWRGESPLARCPQSRRLGEGQGRHGDVGSGGSPIQSRGATNRNQI